MDAHDGLNVHADPAQAQAAMRHALIERQNVGLAVVGGLIGAVIGAALWAVFTVVTGIKIGFMAIGVGWLVGKLAWSLGRGLSPVYGVLGAILALIGCAAGNLVSACYFLSQAPDVELSFWQIIGTMNVKLFADLMKLTFQPMDVLFYGFALYEGYRFSFRRLMI